MSGDSMDFLLYLSNLFIPLLFFYIVANGVVKKVKVYDVFLVGAKEGFDTVVKVAPTLTGLMIGVGILRSSGFLEFAARLCAPVGRLLGIPVALIPVIFVRMFSSSAATGLTLDILKEYGTESFTGFLNSVLMGCTETIFYTMSVYFAATAGLKDNNGKMLPGVEKTRWTLAGALAATLAGIIASVIITKLTLSN